jgi:hypothetical protein
MALLTRLSESLRHHPLSSVRVLLLLLFACHSITKLASEAATVASAASAAAAPTAAQAAAAVAPAAQAGQAVPGATASLTASSTPVTTTSTSVTPQKRGSSDALSDLWVAKFAKESSPQPGSATPVKATSVTQVTKRPALPQKDAKQIRDLFRAESWPQAVDTAVFNVLESQGVTSLALFCE